LAKAKSHIKTLSKIKTVTKIKVDSPGIILKGWFKYIEITPSKTSQEFEINQE
jgi:hypothetical protein